MKTIKWGIIGCGNIANNFAQSLSTLDDGELLAVGSKTPGKAEALAKKFSVEKCYTSYEKLLLDQEVDVVYVATTHNFHYENVLQCLNHGKHVLCEKVFTMNSRQANHLRNVARSKKLFVMEAMWTRFLPATKEINKIISEGIIGDVKFLEAEFSFKAEMNPKGRFYNIDLAGGSLMDQGIYPISYASMIFKKQPNGIKTNVCMAPTGVDERGSHIFEYEDGKAAFITTSISYYRRDDALIAGTKGHIEVPGFLFAKEFSVKVGDKEIEYKIPFTSTGKGYEAQEVMDCIRAGKIQSDIMPIDETVELMETIDSIRNQWGLKYPDEMEKSAAQ
jgi:predicted dehydrogenase